MHFTGSISAQGTRWRHSLAYIAICEVFKPRLFCIDLCVSWLTASTCFTPPYLGLLLANISKCAILQAADFIGPRRFRYRYSGNYPSLLGSCSIQLPWPLSGHWIASGRRMCEDVSRSLASSPSWAFAISPKSYVCSVIGEMCSASFWSTSRCCSACLDNLHRLRLPARSHRLHPRHSCCCWCHRIDQASGTA